MSETASSAAAAEGVRPGESPDGSPLPAARREAEPPRPDVKTTGLRRALGYWISLRTARLTLRVLFRARWIDVRHVPRTGAVLLAANHQSYLDPPLVATGILFRRCAFLARAGLFASSFFGRWISFYNSVPVAEEGGDLVAMRTVIGLIEEDHAVLIFPEGSRCEDGLVGPFKRGAALIIKRTRCPIVPIAIEGGYEAWPRRQSKPTLWRHRVWVLYGEPIAHDELMKDGQEAAMARLRAEVIRLRGVLRARMGKPPLQEKLENDVS